MNKLKGPGKKTQTFGKKTSGPAAKKSRNILVKILSFEARKLEFLPQMLEFFPQGPWVFSKTLKFWRFGVSFLKKWLFLVENRLKMHQIWHFLARFARIEALFAHLQQKNPKIKWLLKFMWLLLLPVRWVLAWKIVEFFRAWVFSKLLKKAWTKATSNKIVHNFWHAH